MKSRKSAIIALAISGLALLAALPAWAQGLGQQGRARHYNPATEMRETGTVEDVREVSGSRGWAGTHILLKTDKEDLDVHLGPTAYLAESGFTFAKGDRIEVMNGGAIIDHGAPCERRFVAVQKLTTTLQFQKH